MNFCNYKNSLGELGKGMHAERINVFGLSLAKNDVIATIGIGILLGTISGLILTFAMELKMDVLVKFWLYNFLFWIIVAFIFGIFMHWLFCVKTELHKFLFE